MLKITIGAMLGAVIGFIICSLLSANKVKENKNTGIDKLAEETRYLFHQIGGLKDRLENIENKADLEHKKIKETLNEIQLNSAVDSNILYKTRKEIKELKETTCRQANNLKNCINNKKKRTRRKSK